MKTELILIGKTTDRHIDALVNDYVKRIGHYMPFQLTIIPDLKNTKNITQEQQKAAEGEAILRATEGADTLVLLDEHGKSMRSIAFAEWMSRRQQTARRLVFVIGGPYGFSEAVYKRADEKISLSEMTFSHQLIRPIFTEQLYRACTILRGEPYHHE